MNNFPKWLPKNVADHCHDKLKSVVYDNDQQHYFDALSDDQKQCIIRLATHETMRSVWQTLSKLPVEPIEWVEFIEFVRLHTSIMYPKLKQDKLAHAKQRKVMQQVSELLNKLLTTLSALTPEQADPYLGLELMKSELVRLGKHHAKNRQGASLVELQTLLESLNSVDQAYGIVDVLKLLHAASGSIKDSPPPDTPRKQASATASRTLLIKDLKHYMRTHFNAPLNQVIASTVNVAMDLPSDSITEDQVRKA